VFAIVSEVDAVPIPPAPSFANQLMLYVPASKNPGVPEIVAVGDAPGVEANAKSAGIPVWLMVIVVPASASVAEAVIGVMATFSVALAVAGAVTTGGEFPLAELTLLTSNQSPEIPFLMPQGSAGSPIT